VLGGSAFPASITHTFVVTDQPTGSPVELNVNCFDGGGADPGCADHGFVLRGEGSIGLLQPNLFGTNLFGVAATEDGVVGPLPLRQCQTGYGTFLEVDRERDGAFDDMSVAVVDGGARPSNFRILFVPVLWNASQAAFDAAAQAQVDYLLAATELGACPDTVQVETLDVGSQNFAAFTCQPGCGLPALTRFVREQVVNSMAYDVIVGLLPAGGSPCPDRVGCANGTDTVWSEGTTSPVLAHEIGHMYGLSDEYCSEEAGGDPRCNDGDDRNRLGADLGCDPRNGFGCCGDCSAAGNPAGMGNYFICCSGNQGLVPGDRCIMAAAGSQTSFCSRCAARFASRTEFRCDIRPGPRTSAVVGVEIQADDTGQVSLSAVQAGFGRPTRTHPPGDRFRAVVADHGGAILLDERFDLLRFDQPDADPEGVFSFKFPIAGSPASGSVPPLRMTVYDGGTTIVLDTTLFGAPPTADAGSDVEVPCGSASGARVTLDGTASTDPEGDAVRFAWSAPGIVFDDPASARPTALFPIGDTTVTLTVSDAATQVATDTVTVRVVDPSRGDLDGDGIGDACDDRDGVLAVARAQVRQASAGRGHLRVKGEVVLAHASDGFDLRSGLAARLVDGRALDAEFVWSVDRCRTLASGRVRCATPDGVFLGDAQPLSAKPDRIRFALRFETGQFTAPFLPDLTLHLAHAPGAFTAGIDRIGTLGACRPTRNGIICRAP